MKSVNQKIDIDIYNYVRVMLDSMPNRICCHVRKSISMRVEYLYPKLINIERDIDNEEIMGTA